MYTYGCSHDALGEGFKPTGYSQQLWEADIITPVFTRRKLRRCEVKDVTDYTGTPEAIPSLPALFSHSYHDIAGILFKAMRSGALTINLVEICHRNNPQI